MAGKTAMNFFINGAPKYIRCYETKREPVIDKFTVVFCHASKFAGKDFIGYVYYVSADEDPTYPLGFYQHGTAQRGEFCPCGSRIKWQDLPEKLREVVFEEYCDVWGINPTVDADGNVVMAERRTEGE
jgi:hypothetical protein